MWQGWSCKVVVVFILKFMRNRIRLKFSQNGQGSLVLFSLLNGLELGYMYLVINLSGFTQVYLVII